MHIPDVSLLLGRRHQAALLATVLYAFHAAAAGRQLLVDPILIVCQRQPGKFCKQRCT